MKRALLAVCVSVCVFSVSAAPGQLDADRVKAATAAAAAPAPAHSAPVSFDFAGVPLMQFAQAIYRDSLGRDYVVSAELVDVQKKVSIRVKSLALDKLPAFVDQVLRSQGVAATLKDGVYYLDVVKDATPAAVDSPPGDHAKAGKAEQKLLEPPRIFVMRAQNRPAEFLASVLNGVFGAETAKVGSASVLVVSVRDDREKAVRDVLAQIDTPAASVEVVASFIEVSRGTDEARGLALVNAQVSRKLGVTFDTLGGTATLQAGSYQAVLNALSGDSRFKQVTNSRLVGDEGEKLSLLVGDETPTIGSSTRDNQGNPIQNVVYRPSGVILDVQPKVTGSGRLALVVDGQVSAFQSTVNGVSGSPTLVKRQVKTSVSLADGQVLVIGGLDDSKVQNTNGGFSFLPASWRARSDHDAKTDLVLILSARVLPGAVKNSL